MPGPMSTPRGGPRNPEEREELAKKGKLYTGKTEKDVDSGKWGRRLQNRRARALAKPGQVAAKGKK